MDTSRFDIWFVPSHFSQVCYCAIPDYWRAEDPETGFYADGISREDAIESLIALLG